ncbi:MAG: FAD-dependent oxidoreductase [Methanoregula sp.]
MQTHDPQLMGTFALRTSPNHVPEKRAIIFMESRDSVSFMEYQVRVMEVVSHGNFAFSVRFKRPSAFPYLPGQYMFITIGTGSTALTKHLTLSSSPSNAYLEVTKGSTGHPFAEALRALKAGDEVVIRGPFGDFTFHGEYAKVAFIAGGIGITPFWSMMRYATGMRLDTDIRLLCSAKIEPEILFREEMAELSLVNPHLGIITTLTEPGPGWTGRTGRINADMIVQEIPDWQERVFFVSGPPAMVNAMLSVLREMGLTEDRIRSESFPGY